MAKVALLIGVTNYQPGLNPLPSAERDVQALAKVLQRPEVGGFDQVKSLLNPSSQQMQEEIEALFRDRHRDDLVFLFFSGHGIKDDSSKLYFATSLTQKTPRGELVKSSAVPASFVHEIMSDSKSKRQVVMLDCCFSGAFAEGMTAKDDGRVDVQRQLGGEGRAVLASSTSTQYSFEQQGTDLSVYTHYIIEGIETGSADQDNDGMISVNDLHEYAKCRVQEAFPAMKPEIHAIKEGYQINLAQALISDPKLRYRREVSRFAERGEISDIARVGLDTKYQMLGLVPEEAAEIEHDVLKPSRTYRVNLRQYGQKLREAALRKYPISPETRSDLDYLKQALGLRNEDVEPFEAHIAARHREVRMESAPPLLQPNRPLLNEIDPLQSGLMQPVAPVAPLERSPQLPQHSSTVSTAPRQPNRLLQGLLAAGAILAIGSVGFYGYQRSQQNQQGQTALQQALALANQEKWGEAIAKLQQVPITSSATSQSQQYLESWSQQLLKYAEARYQSGSLEEALGYAQVIPQVSPLYNDAQKAIAQWQAESDSDNQLLTEIENVLKVWDITTAAALFQKIQNPGLKQQAEARISKVALLSADAEKKQRWESDVAKQQAERAQRKAEADAARLNLLSKQPPLTLSQGYQYAWLSSRGIIEADLSGKSGYELNIMRNSIYARHGRIFKEPEFRSAFSQELWYRPTYTSEEFKQLLESNLKSQLISDLEIQNATYIQNYQTKMNRW